MFDNGDGFEFKEIKYNRYSRDDALLGFVDPALVAGYIGRIHRTMLASLFVGVEGRTGHEEKCGDGTHVFCLGAERCQCGALENDV